MSFGFGISDIVTVTKLANGLRKQFVDSPSQFQAICDEVKGLSNVLRDIEDVLPMRELTEGQKSGLREIYQGCENTLTDLEKTVVRYRFLTDEANTIRGKSRRAWKRLEWEPDDIKDLRSRIACNTSLLNAFNGELTRNCSLETKRIVNRLGRHQDNQERRTILDWLTRIDYSVQHNEFSGRQQSSTGLWLLNSNPFQTWLGESQTLFCPGIPGAGKTIMTSLVVDHLAVWKESRKNLNVGIAYIYCSYRDPESQKPADLLASLMRQLIQEHTALPEEVMQLYKHHQQKRSRPRLNKMLEVLHSVIRTYSRVFILIDALDECQMSDGDRDLFLSHLSNLLVKTKANIFFTSRPMPAITRHFEGAILIEIRANDEDVRKYLNGQMSGLPLCVSKHPELQERIKSGIVEAVDGMFLLARLHIDSLGDKTTVRAVKLALERLPRGSEALDQAYHEAVERINRQKFGLCDLAMQLLSWITLTTRPLTISELQQALAVESGEYTIDEENFHEVEDMISVCAGLVTVDDETNTIHLVHYTTQEYLERNQLSLFSRAQERITMTCLTYLSYEHFVAGPCASVEEFLSRLQSHLLYEYAAKNWGHHARLSSEQMTRSILNFLERKSHVQSAVQTLLFRVRWSAKSENININMSTTQLAAFFGLDEFMKALIETGNELRPTSLFGETPLCLAAGNGHLSMVRLLLNGDDVNETRSSQLPLLIAAQNGQEEVVKLLLATKGFNVNARDGHHQTPLSLAISYGHESTAKLLLTSPSIWVSSTDPLSESPLLYAAWSGQTSIVRLLLERPELDTDWTGKGQFLAISYALRFGHEEVAKLLLTRSSKCSRTHEYFHMWAKSQEDKELVKRLDPSYDPPYTPRFIRTKSMRFTQFDAPFMKDIERTVRSFFKDPDLPTRLSSGEVKPDNLNPVGPRPQDLPAPSID